MPPKTQEYPYNDPSLPVHLEPITFFWVHLELLSDIDQSLWRNTQDPIIGGITGTSPDISEYSRFLNVAPPSTGCWPLAEPSFSDKLCFHPQLGLRPALYPLR